MAVTVLGSKEVAEEWFRRPSIGKEQRRQIDLGRTPSGEQILVDHLGRIDHGVHI